MPDFFTSNIATTDPLISDALNGELYRQQTQLELIASENIVSRAVLDALAHEGEIPDGIDLQGLSKVFRL